MEDVEKIIEDTVKKTVMELKLAGLLKTEYKSATQKTEELLRNYPRFKLSEQPYTKKVCEKVEAALNTIRPEPYYELIPLYYFEGMTRGEVAEFFNTTEITISRNKKKLLDAIAAVLFSDELLYELFL